tara:strand:+ start:88 stop:291 length:204 start_codon:yes stop_codon:yes gene_type:complete
MDEKPTCEICKRIRFIVVAVAITAIVGFRPEFDFLRGIDITKYFAWGLFFLAIAILVWKSYFEFWKK